MQPKEEAAGAGTVSGRSAKVMPGSVMISVCGEAGNKEPQYITTKSLSIPKELLDQLLAGTNPAAALNQGGLLNSLKKAFAERALSAEMDHHLGHDDQAGNIRNGYGRETVIKGNGKIVTEMPRGAPCKSRERPVAGGCLSP